MRFAGLNGQSGPNPKYVETYLALGFLEQDQGNTAAAMANYQKAADLEPDGPADYFNRANIAAGLYQWDEAMADLRGGCQNASRIFGRLITCWESNWRRTGKTQWRRKNL